MMAALVALSLASPVLAFDVTLTTDGDSEDLRKVIKNTSLVFAAHRDELTDADEIIAAAQADYARLIGVFYQAGHYGPDIRIRIDGREAGEILPGSRITAVKTVEITTSGGNRFALGTTQIAPLAEGTTLPDDFAPGEIAHLSVIRDTVRAATDGWRQQGHAKADVDRQNISANHAKRRLDVDISMAPGPRLTFGRLIIPNPSEVREDRLRRIVSLPSGQQFDPDDIDRAVRRLRRTGAFSIATLTEVETPNRDGSLDMVLETTDAKTRRIGVGAELESDAGININAFWLHRNVFGGGERFRLEGDIKGIGGTGTGTDFRLNADFTRPATWQADTDFSLNLEVKRLDEPLYLVHQATLSAGVSRYFSKTRQGTVNLQFVRTHADDDFGTRWMSHIAVPVSMTWNHRSDDLNPVSGAYLKAGIAPFVGFDAGGDGARATADARAYYALGEDNGVVFAGRVQFGAVIGPSLAATPPNWLFLSGGGGTVRGTRYQSNSVVTGTTESGGRSFLGLSGEARIRITDAISTVLFVDAGYIGAESIIDGSGTWHSGAGIGLRYDTGIGPIRLDVAGPVSGPGADGLQVYVGIGQAF